MRIRFTPPLPCPAEVDLEVLPLVPLPDNFAAWADNLLIDQLPDETPLEVLAERDDRTDLGWPIRVVETRADLAGSAVHRIHVLYRFIDHGAALVASSEDADRLAAAWPAIAEAIRSGRPDWSADHEVAALAQLWDGVVWA